jgi:hypothetical protein
MFGSHEKITKCKNQSLTNVAGIPQRPVAVSGFRRESLIGSDWIRSYPVGSRPFWPNPAEIFRIQQDQWPNRVISSRILVVLATSVQIRQYPDRFGQIRPAWPESDNISAGIWFAGGLIPTTGLHRTPALTGFRRPTIVKF